MKLLDTYFEIQKEIYDYFGYEESWKVIPLDDCREYFWWIDEVLPDVVRLAETIEDLTSDQCCSLDIFTYTHFEKYVFEGPEYTMICVDTNTDGNKFLQIFDNAKRVHGELDENDELKIKVRSS